MITPRRRRNLYHHYQSSLPSAAPAISAATACELPLAMSNAVLPSLFLTERSAPFASKTFATSGWFVMAVFISGVAPITFWQLALAPCLRSRSASSGKPRHAQPMQRMCSVVGAIAEIWRHACL